VAVTYHGHTVDFVPTSDGLVCGVSIDGRKPLYCYNLPLSIATEQAKSMIDELDAEERLKMDGRSIVPRI
jgi:hypothetical protein